MAGVPNSITSFAQFVREYTYQAKEEDVWVKNSFLETMRINGSNPSSLYSSSENPLNLGSVKIEPNENVIVPIQLLHESPQQWQQPKAFRPERFIRNDPLSLTPKGEKRHPNSLVPFLPGPRSCIGQGYTEILINLVVTMTVHLFDISYIGEVDGVEQVEFKTRHNLTT